jgi:hypothetical protein
MTLGSYLAAQGQLGGHRPLNAGTFHALCLHSMYNVVMSTFMSRGLQGGGGQLVSSNSHGTSPGVVVKQYHVAVR